MISTKHIAFGHLNCPKVTDIRVGDWKINPLIQTQKNQERMRASVACIVSCASSGMLGDLKVVAGLQVTIHRIEITILERHVAGIVLDIDQLFADV